jgi:glycosyltransferase involved in cell wall biosynthesis
MRVLCLTPNRLGYSPGQRGSIELWESVLRPAGIDIVFAPFETERLRSILYEAGHRLTKATEMIRGYINRTQLLQNLDEFDAVFIYREAALMGPAILETLIARRKPIIYQLDDPLFVPYRSPSNGYLSYLKFFGKIKKIISISKVVIVNSTPIREYAEQYNRNIWQIPSVVDTEKFSYVPSPERPDRVCIGWSGSPTTLKNIGLVAQPLKEISDKDICDIHLIGGTEFPLDGVKYTAQNWSAETEVEDLRRMQIGLVPLPNQPWNQYKFIMKTAQYMALGIVPVGTPLSSNVEVIQHGKNGFLAKDDSEWKEYLGLLVNDHDLRSSMSARSAKDAIEKYSLKANAVKVIDAFRNAVKPLTKTAQQNG